MYKPHRQLTSLPFLIGLFLLLANDFVLKDYLHNYFTGKLSDFCGLFVFVIFWSVLFPKARGGVFFISALVFIMWKSPYSQGFIDLFSKVLFPIHRVVDLSDLMALLILPIAWVQLDSRPRRSFLNPLITGVLALFSFCATSIGPEVEVFKRPQYVLFEDSDIELDTTAQYLNELKYHRLGALLAIEVKSIQIGVMPPRRDDFQKNLILRDLDDRVIKEINASDFRTIKKPIGEHAFVVQTDAQLDSLNFYGSRLHGRFTRSDTAGKILIKGQYKQGIEDSVWVFNDFISNSVTKVTFENGEAIRSEEYQDNKLVSANSITTRAEAVENKYFHIAIFFCLMIGAIVLIIRNYRLTYPATISFRLLEKICYPIVLAFAVYIILFISSKCIPDSFSPLFKLFTDAFLCLITLPIFWFAFFIVKIRRKIDILLYVLVVAFFFIVLQEFKQLERLTKPTIKTVNSHPIGNQVKRQWYRS